MSNEIVTSRQGFLKIDTLENARESAKILLSSGLVPSSFIYGKSADAQVASILIALQAGAELGLTVMNSIQGIAVINGKPMIWGDTVLGLCQASQEFEYCDESFDETNNVAICKVKRKNKPEVVRKFSYDDAKAAGLYEKRGKDGSATPWILYRKRMCQLRARNFALRDAFADKLKGIRLVEDYIGHEEVEINPFDKTVQETRQETFGNSQETLNPIESIKNKVRLYPAQINFPEVNIPAQINFPEVNIFDPTAKALFEGDSIADYERLGEFGNDKHRELSKITSDLPEWAQPKKPIEQLKWLIDVQKVPQSKIALWLAKAQVEKLEDLTDEQISKCIKSLEKKEQGK